MATISEVVRALAVLGVEASVHTSSEGDTYIGLSDNDAVWLRNDHGGDRTWMWGPNWEYSHTDTDALIVAVAIKSYKGL